MYSDKKKTLNPAAILAVLAVILLLAAALAYMGRGTANFDREAAASVKQAIERGALQCYVVEGAYPSDMDYLKDNYGLSVNTKDFYINYDAFASNLAPDVRVEPKRGGK